ncbi:oxygen-independent coproporphyrinogen III oxidase [bacterium]|nr:oxygen-independent coproporphyrinogen III oxidase [bacterium]MBU1676233.1 oxygen-independent coproporphyrinogen III oxidase [bacterium]
MTVHVTRELLARHDVPGPRYTSYPTVPVWSRDFDESDYRDALRELAGRPQDELSIYLHLPFCAKHCHYCGCNAVMTREKNAVDAYLDRVEREIDAVVDIIGRGRRTVQIHWGGGTPNYLKPHQVERALGLLRDRFDVAPDAEVSLEIDPRIGSPEQARHLQSVGFNRISLGVQDFEPDVQKAIGRLQSRERTLRVYHGCREAGFEGVNVDLVYGLPGQTRDSFADTLREVVALAPDRAACFSYAHVPWVRPDQGKVDTTRMPEGYEKFELFRLAIDVFDRAGYDWIGIDHFAKRGDELAVARRERRLHRNFMGYTTRPAPQMLAFGMSGIGEVCGRFVQNDSGLESWSASIDAGRLPVVRGHVLTGDDRLRRLTILNLMCNNELPYALTVPEFGAPANELLAGSLESIKPYADEGFVAFAEDRLLITDLGRHFVRNVCMELDAYLDHDSSKPLFSRTV